MNQIVRPMGGASVTLPALFVPTPEAGKRFIEFFTANIRNANTRRAYTKAVVDFSVWCEQVGLTELRAIEPVQVAAYIEALQSRLSAPSVKVPTPEAGKRFIEFFTANIRNANTRRAYTKAVVDFSVWCEQVGLDGAAGD